MRFRALLTALALGLLTLSPQPADAQVVLFVNGDPITAFDIEQRGRFNQLTTRKAPVRKEVIDELIDEKLKLSAARRYNLEITDTEVDNALANVARRMRATPEQLTQQLASSGVNIGTFKARLKADLAWQQIVRGKFQSSLQVREIDIIQAMDSRKKDEKDAVGYDYILRPVLFVLPKGAPQAAVEARKREAEGLRARFQSCEEGLPFARALNDVAVRDQIVRNSADLAPALRTILDNVAVGRLTPPETTPNGVEMFALCGKRETTADTAAKREIRDEMFAERFSARAKRYLKELRSAAMIEYKQ